MCPSPLAQSQDLQKLICNDMERIVIINGWVELRFEYDGFGFQIG
jgi:hypothetical protein